MSVTQALELMGLTHQATEDDLRTAYRRLARQFHPDVSSDASAHQKMQQLNAAKAVLSRALSNKPHDHPHKAEHRAYRKTSRAGTYRTGYGGTFDFFM